MRLLRATCTYTLLALACSTACSDTTRIELDPMLGGSTGGMPHEPDEPISDTEAIKLDVGADDTGGLGESEECASFSESAESVKRPADIIFVVDNSPSMVQEANAVQEQLNAFSQQIVDAGIDVRVFLLTSYPNPDISPDLDTGICIEPPLGSGGCPTADNNPPIFSHLHDLIGSSQALMRLIATHEQWAPIIREESVKHIIVVSDDDSFLSASEFDQQFRDLDPSYADYALHGIVSLDDCIYADTVGEQYVSLAQMTNGILGDLCEQDWQPLFDLLSTAVIEGTDLACDWAIPTPPEGKLVDPQSIDVHFEADDGTTLDFGPVADEAACADTDHGFYLDSISNPTRMFACPQTCATIQAADEASIDFEVGCASPRVG